jgi:23S rRNA pseudouridine2605 synthase
MSEKLQKVLAGLGLGSRRHIEAMIADGRIQVDGQVAHLGQRIEGHEAILVDNQVITASPISSTQLLIYHKPEGLVCTRSDEEGRPTVFEDLPPCSEGRWIMVGRLDLNTTGLLLFTNDGEFAHRLMHPSHELEREYAVRIYGSVEASMLTRLKKGVLLEDGEAHFDAITDAGGEGSNHWYHVMLKRGRNREVRRLWESQGVTVSRLIRIRYGAISLPSTLAPGKSRMATAQEIQSMRDLCT